MPRRQPRRYPGWAVALLAIAVLLIGIFWGGHPGALPEPARKTLVANTDGRVYDETIDTLRRDYYRPLNGKKLLNKSLTSAIASLNDPYSHYFSPTDYGSFELDTAGQFEGVGMSVSGVKDGLKVDTVYAGSPAQRGGLRVGDVIVSANGHNLKGKTSDQSTALIKGPVGTTVRLGVRHDGKGAVHLLALKRAKVDIPVVESKLEHYKGQKIGWVHLSSFTEGSHTAVSDAVHKMLNQGAKGIVFDLRENGGGLLNEAVQIASIFIPEGRIVSTKGRTRPEQDYNATGGAISTKIPVVMLVNQDSASASEIVTAALQDHHRAKVVGTHTYGKGVFQEIENLPNGGALDITVGEFFTPNGRNLGGGGVKRGAGVTPDIKASDNPKTPRDEALDTALNTVAGEL